MLSSSDARERKRERERERGRANWREYRFPLHPSDRRKGRMEMQGASRNIFLEKAMRRRSKSLHFSTSACHPCAGECLSSLRRSNFNGHSKILILTCAGCGLIANFELSGVSFQDSIAGGKRAGQMGRQGQAWWERAREGIQFHGRLPAGRICLPRFAISVMLVGPMADRASVV